MATKGYNLEQTGEQVQAALNKVIGLGPATEEVDGLMSATDKASLENLNTEINDKVDKVAGKGLSTNDFTNEEKSKLDTAYQVPSTGIPAADMSSSVQTSLSKADSALQEADLTPITEKIPAQASASNQLADKAFVNSSIATAAADFKGTYDSLAELQQVTANNNDYGYVVSTDQSGNTVYSRYKYNGSAWVFEYDLNNSSFTAAEWAAIQSQITSALVQKLSALPTNQQLTQSLSGKQDTISDLASIRSGAASGATAYQKPAAGIPKTDLNAAVNLSLERADEATVRPYDSQSPNGMGYLVLEKDKTFASQVTEANTIYEIRYDFDLNNASVTIPAGCTLKFNGGKVDNGTLVISDTLVDALPTTCFGSGLTVAGIFNQAVYPEWFGAAGDGATNDRDAIQKAIDSSNNVVGIIGKTYAVATPTPYVHCLTISRDNQHLTIELKNTDVYDTSDYRGRAVIFCDSKNGFVFNGSITSVNDSLPISSSSGMSLEYGRGGIMCWGDCSDFEVDLVCSNLYCGFFSGALINKDYLSRNGTTGVSNGVFNIRANRVAYPVAINNGSNNVINVIGEKLHRCVYLCGDYNKIYASGKDYYGTAAPAHVMLFANFIEQNGVAVLISSNYNDVTYKELDGGTQFINEGSIFAFQPLALSEANNPPEYTHVDYGFIGNTFNAYCINTPLRTGVASYIFLSPASNWTYDQDVVFDFVINIYGDATNYVFRGIEYAVGGLTNNVTINNFTAQKVKCQIRDNKADSYYRINGNQNTVIYSLSGVTSVTGNKVECQIAGSTEIIGDLYVSAANLSVSMTTDYNQKHVHISYFDYYPSAPFRRATPSASMVGVYYFETSNGKPNFWTGTKWVEADGIAGGTRRKGTTAQRPASSTIVVGFTYFDTDLGKMIVWNGTAWVNMDGTALS